MKPILRKLILGITLSLLILTGTVLVCHTLVFSDRLEAKYSYADPVQAAPEPTPEPSPTTAPTPSPKPKPTPEPQRVFRYVDGEIYWLSIDEDRLWEYFSFLQDELGLNNAAAAGVLCNLQEESGFNPRVLGDEGASGGICQWSGYRLRDMKAWCLERDLNPDTIESQLRYLAYDLEHNYIYAHELLLSCEDNENGALAATYYFCAYYESPADPDSEMPERQTLTKQLVYPSIMQLIEDRVSHWW